MNKKTKLLMGLAIGALIILVGSTVVRCTMVHQDDSVGQIVPADVSAKPAKSDEGTPKQDLPTDEADALSLLRENVWTADGGKSTITFKDGRFVESDGVASNMTTFDVSSVTKEASQTTIALKLDTANGASKDSVVLLRQDASGTYTVSSDDFTLAKTYSQGQSNQNPLALEGINDEFRELLGGSTDALEHAISDYAHAKVPTATKAAWDKVLVVDYAQNTVSANFTCNDTAKTVLTVEYARATAAYTVMG